MSLISSKLFGCGYHYQIFTISYENSAFAGGNKDEAVLSIIDIQIGGDIEDEEGAVFAVIDIELLLFDRIYLFDPEGLGFVEEAVVVRVYLFLDIFRL